MNETERRVAIRRIAELTNGAWELAGGRMRMRAAGLRIDEAAFRALKIGAMTAFWKWFGETHAYTHEFGYQVKDPLAGSAESAARILEVALADLEALDEPS